MTPDGTGDGERYRLVVEGPPELDLVQRFLADVQPRRAAVVVASTYTRVGGLYDSGFRHDPSRPLESSPTTASVVTRTWGSHARRTCSRSYIREYQADGFLVNSVRAATRSAWGSS